MLIRMICLMSCVCYTQYLMSLMGRTTTRNPYVGSVSKASVMRLTTITRKSTLERERVTNSSCPAAANGLGAADNSHMPEVPEVLEGTVTNNPQYNLHTVDYGREHVCALNTVQLAPAILTPRPTRFWPLRVSNHT